MRRSIFSQLISIKFYFLLNLIEIYANNDGNYVILFFCFKCFVFEVLSCFYFTNNYTQTVERIFFKYFFNIKKYFNCNIFLYIFLIFKDKYCRCLGDISQILCKCTNFIQHYSITVTYSANYNYISA